MRWDIALLAFLAGAGIGAAIVGYRALQLIARIFSTVERLDQIDREITRNMEHIKKI